MRWKKVLALTTKAGVAINRLVLTAPRGSSRLIPDGKSKHTARKMLVNASRWGGEGKASILQEPMCGGYLFALCIQRNSWQ